MTFKTRSRLSLFTLLLSALAGWVLLAPQPAVGAPAAPAEDPPDLIDGWGGTGSGNGSFASIAGTAVDPISGEILVVDSSDDDIQRFSPSGTYIETIATFNGSDTFSDPRDVAFSPSGYMFVADTNNNRIVRFANDGTYLGQWSTGGGTNLSEPRGIAVGPAGSVFVADHGNARLVKYTASGDFIDERTYPSTNNIYDVAVDHQGNVFTVVHIPASSVLAYKYDNNFNYITVWGGPIGTTDGRFTLAQHIATDTAGNVYISDDPSFSSNDRIQKFAPDGSYILTFSRATPRGLAVDATGDLYVTANNFAFQYRPQITAHCQMAGNVGNQFGNVSTRLSQDLDPDYQLQWGGSGTADGQFYVIADVAVDAAGNVFTVDSSQREVQKFGPDGTHEATVSSGAFGSVGITIAGGNVFVIDQNNGYLVKFDNDLNLITSWYPSGLSAPTDIAYSSRADSVYIVNRGTDTIRQYDAGSLSYYRQWGGTGSGPGQFDDPEEIAVDAEGNVYVVDRGNDRIQKFDSIGTYITEWGGTGSGPGQFIDPVGINIGPSGSVYVVDEDTNRIQKFDSTGTFLAQWGTGGSGAGSFSIPRGIAVALDGSVYVGDTGNDLVQKFHRDACLEMTLIDTDHPSAPSEMQTGQYWQIAATGTITADLTLPTTSSVLPPKYVCRHEGGSNWDCASDSTTSNSVTRNDVNNFSDWAVGRFYPPASPLLTFFHAGESAGTPGSYDVTLTWHDSSGIDDNVWSSTYAYFNPGDAGAVLEDTLPNDNTITLSGISSTRYFRIEPVNEYGVTNTPTDPVGVFFFGITPGD